METTILFGNEAEAISLSSQKSLPAPTIFTGQRLEGTIIFSQYGTSRPVFDAVQLILKGKVRNVITQAVGYWWEIEKPLVQMSCVKVAEDFHRSSFEGSTTHQADFFFDVPEFITVPSDEKHPAHQLPPSIRVVKRDSPSYYPKLIKNTLLGYCDVMYHVEARVFNGGRIVCIARREIIVMATMETPPPLDPDDLKYEYLLSARSSLDSFWKAKKSLTVSVSSKEPPPVVFPSLKEEYSAVGTELSFDFKTREMYDMGGVILMEPPVTECEVMVTLKAITYFLKHEKDRVLSITESTRDSRVLLKRSTFKTQKRKIKLEGWTRAIDTSSDTTPMIEWKTTALLTTFLPDDVPHLPSFFSTLVSRRYAFDVQIAFGKKLGSKPLRLRIPVQIVHAPVGKHLRGPSDVGFKVDSKAPAYVP